MAIRLFQIRNFFRKLKSIIWDPFDERSGHCPDCSTQYPRGERFCYHCGEERSMNGRDEPVTVLLGDFLVETLTVNRKLPLTFAWLFLSPGKLTRAYYIGVRNKVLKPLTILSVTLGIFYTFFSSVTLFHEGIKELSNGFYAKSISVSNLTKFHIDSALAEKSGQLNKKSQVVNAEVDQRSMDFSKTYFWIIWPLWALIIAVILRGTQYYFSYHLVCAAHIFGAYLIGWLLIVTYVFFIKDYAIITGYQTLIINIPFIFYVVVYLRNAYRISLFKAIWSGTFCSLMFFGVIIMFRQTVLILSLLTLSR
ncbi:positive regulator of sigma E activity/predicted nucleic acid-binding Zn ribbon protein [Mucilaginibacter rubeus]|uniref:DUF3667 domain-containing protein n=1 Tax=Mucilaginibacter rubeus TaxID=2027860 RepID=UPI0033948CAD